MDNLEEMDKFFKVQLSKTELGRNKIWAEQSQPLKSKLWWKIFQQTKAQGEMASQMNSTKHLKN